MYGYFNGSYWVLDLNQNWIKESLLDTMRKICAVDDSRLRVSILVEVLENVIRKLIIKKPYEKR
jgi:hypothetical protein